MAGAAAPPHIIDPWLQVASDAWKKTLDAVAPAVVVLKVTQTRCGSACGHAIFVCGACAVADSRACPDSVPEGSKPSLDGEFNIEPQHCMHACADRPPAMRCQSLLAGMQSASIAGLPCALTHMACAFQHRGRAFDTESAGSSYATGCAGPRGRSCRPARMGSGAPQWCSAPSCGRSGCMAMRRLPGLSHAISCCSPQPAPACCSCRRAADSLLTRPGASS